jgi:LemA protein
MHTYQVLLLISIIIIYFWYVGIIKRKNQVLEALSGVDVQLTKRKDLIPNILIIAQKFMEHEKNLLAEVTALREKIDTRYRHNDAASIEAFFNKNNELTERMSNLLLQVENYPSLKSDQTMLQAQLKYSEVEDNISAARRFYNTAVADLNILTQVFPGNLIAIFASSPNYPFYKASDEIKQVIDVSAFLQ